MLTSIVKRSANFSRDYLLTERVIASARRVDVCFTRELCQRGMNARTHVDVLDIMMGGDRRVIQFYVQLHAPARTYVTGFDFRGLRRCMRAYMCWG